MKRWSAAANRAAKEAVAAIHAGWSPWGVRQPPGFGRVRMRHVSDAAGARLVPFVRDVVGPEAVVLTDDWGGYNGRAELGYTQKPIMLASSGDPVHVSMLPCIEVARLLKRWIRGTHQGSIVPAHLQSDLEEFTFRFNRRTSRSRGRVFRRLLEQTVVAILRPAYSRESPSFMTRILMACSCNGR